MTVGLRGAGDADELADELQRGGERHGARQVARATKGSSASRRRYGEGADRSRGEAVGDQQRVAQAAHRQHGAQHQWRHGVEAVIEQQQPACVLGRRPARPSAEKNARRHQRHLREADREGIHVQDDRGQQENSTIWMPSGTTTSRGRPDR